MFYIKNNIFAPLLLEFIFSPSAEFFLGVLLFHFPFQLAKIMGNVFSI